MTLIMNTQIANTKNPALAAAQTNNTAPKALIKFQALETLKKDNTTKTLFVFEEELNK